MMESFPFPPRAGCVGGDLRRITLQRMEKAWGMGCFPEDVCYDSEGVAYFGRSWQEEEAFDDSGEEAEDWDSEEEEWEIPVEWIGRAIRRTPPPLPPRPSRRASIPPGACCPSNVNLYRMANSSLRVYWRSSSPQNHTVELIGTSSNHTCVSSNLSSSCDIAGVMCGDTYSLVVAPVNQYGSRVTFCPQRIYTVSCIGNYLGTVIYRGKRSVT